MNNKEILNPYESQTVGKIAWPFYRYSALIPESIGGDLFVWLYLSLVIYTNESNGRSKWDYSDETKTEVVSILKSKFSAVIDDQTLEKIINNAESDFVAHDKEKHFLTEETFSFVETYETLFSDKLEIKYIYQDGITGEVLPFFGDTSYIEESRNDNTIRISPIVKEPSKKRVQNAYKQYKRLMRFNSNDDEIEVELSDEYIDEDEETFFDDGSSEIEFAAEQPKEAPKEKNSLKNYNVIFLKDQRVIFNLDVDVVVKDNALIIRSPFNTYTDSWINKCLQKGRNVSRELDAVIEDYEKLFLLENKKIESYIEGHKHDFADSLNYCQTIYRLIDPLNDNRLREYVLKMDSMFSEKNELFYFYAGKILDRFIRYFKYPKTSADDRRTTTYDMFCSELDYELGRTVLAGHYYCLKNKNIYDNWVKKYGKRDGKEFISFKADIADVFLKTNLASNKVMYPSLVEDMFALYSKRSKVDHDDADSDDIKVLQTDLDTLTKVLRVLMELV